MKVLVTGATGFIASHLIPKLVERGHEVYALQRQVAGRYVLGGCAATDVFCDLRDYFAVRKTIAELQADAVVQLGALTAVAYSYDHPQEVFRVNTLGTINLAEACLREVPFFKMFLFAGTSEEYGHQIEFPIKETAELRADSPYSASKIAADKYLQYLRDAYDFPITILRPFNTYGRKRDAHFVVERAITQLLQSSVVRLGDITAVRDFMYVDDHVDAYLTCLENEKAVGDIFNFCTGRGVSIKELVEKIAAILNVKATVVPSTIPKRPLDIPVLIGDNSKAKEVLGWSPKFSLEQGLELAIQHWQKEIRQPLMAKAASLSLAPEG